MTKKKECTQFGIFFNYFFSTSKFNLIYSILCTICARTHSFATKIYKTIIQTRNWFGWHLSVFLDYCSTKKKLDSIFFCQTAVQMANIHFMSIGKLAPNDQTQIAFEFEQIH